MFIEKTKFQKLNKIKPESYHGHTIIELHNHRTGFRERIEHDNTFTNAINNYLLTSGRFNNSPYANSTWVAQALYRNLIGGILLFDNTIEAVDGVYPTMMPAGTKMIANGSYGVANNSAVTEMGSYNSNESSFTDEALTFVYDWSTSQGNGEIACLSLTSDIGGYIGYGNSVSQVSLSSKKSLLENQSSVQVGIKDSNDKAIFIHGDLIHWAYTVSESATQLIYYTRNIPINSKLSLFENDTKYTVDLPEYVKGIGARYIIPADVGFAVVKLDETNMWRNSAGPKPLAIYNVDTGTWSQHTAQPTYNEQIQQISASSVHKDIICIGGHYTPGSVVTRLDTHEVVAPVTSNNAVFFALSDDLYLRGTDSQYINIVDDVNHTVYPANGTVPAPSMNGYVGWMEQSRNRILSVGNGSVLNMYRNPLYLATINNLDEPVTKTSETTMKVIYTVTPAT